MVFSAVARSAHNFAIKSPVLKGSAHACGSTALLAPLIMPGVVSVNFKKLYRLRKEFRPLLRTQALQAH